MFQVYHEIRPEMSRFKPQIARITNKLIIRLIGIIAGYEPKLLLIKGTYRIKATHTLMLEAKEGSE